MQISNEEFKSFRPLLFALGYRLLGSVAETEDLVQETFLRAYEVDEHRVNDKKAYLCKMMTNRCLDALRSARKKREQYTGPWNPEPYIPEKLHENDPLDDVLEKEGLSIAYLRMMEHLSPQERAVVILRDVFSYPYAEAAEMIGRKEDHLRKLYSRAKVKLSKVEKEVLDYTHNKRIIDQFIAALHTQNKEQLLQLLSEHVTLYSDGGGKVLAALRPVETSAHVLAFLSGILNNVTEDYVFEISKVNGQPAVLNYMNGQLHSIVSCYIEGNQIQELYITSNPDKLSKYS